MTDVDLAALMPSPPRTPPPQTHPNPASPARARQETQMATLRQALASCLMPDDNGAEMLKRQLATLDALFDHIVADYAAQTNSAIGYSQSERLDVLLRLQHNCTRTARTLSAMDYMAGLSPPPPFKNDEQKEDGA